MMEKMNNKITMNSSSNNNKEDKVIHRHIMKEEKLPIIYFAYYLV